MSESIIEVVDVTRDYQTEVGIVRRKRKSIQALRGISFSVGEGEIFGLLGPNGAGKTTTIKILTTLLIPTSGRVRILGLDPVTQFKKLRPQINFILGGERNLYWRLSAIDNLAYFADLYKVPRSVQRTRLMELLDRVGLADAADRKVETFSKGMKQRLQIARGLVNAPKVLFLDEPTIGLDPVSARQLRSILREMNQQGTTIVLTTHYMYEADELCKRIAFIDKGQIVALDTPERLKSITNQHAVVECQIDGAAEHTITMLGAMPEVTGLQTEIEGQSVKLRLHTKVPQFVVPRLYDTLGGRISHLSIASPTLEDAYIQLVGGTRH